MGVTLNCFNQKSILLYSAYNLSKIIKRGNNKSENLNQ
jgi:hypothetical protein